MSIEAINWVFKQDDLHNSGAKFVLTVLANYADENGRCYPSQETLASKCAMTDRSVRNHLDWLEEHGYITPLNRQKGNDFSSNLYQLEFDKEKKQSFPMSRKKRVGAENISAQESDGAENISDREKGDENTDLGRKTFPNGAENISYNTLALKEDTKGLNNGGGSTVSTSTSAGDRPPPPTISESPPEISKLESRTDYLLRKQIEYPHFNVEQIYADFKRKCGSLKYPNLKDSQRSFDNWLKTQDVEFTEEKQQNPAFDEADYFAKKYGGLHNNAA